MLYSLIATTPRPISIAEPPVTLEPGRNVFTSLTDDIDALVAILTTLGATVVQVNVLTQPPTSALDMVLEGETPASVLGADYGRR